MVGVKNDLREKKKKTVNTDIKSYSPVPQLFFSSLKMLQQCKLELLFLASLFGQGRCL
jgi:hypothetical protein